MRITTFCIVLVTLTVGLVRSQTAQFLTLSPNQEICLRDTLPVIIRFTNPDTVMRTLDVAIRFQNVATGVSVYTHYETILDVPPGSSVDHQFPDYVTSPNLLTQLGTFLACIEVDVFGDTTWPFRDSICWRFFGIRTTNLPFNDPSNDYSITSFGQIPDQRKWVTCGATVVDGDFLTWDPPPPRTEPHDTNGFGIMNLRSPLVRLDRLDMYGRLYEGNGVGDTITSLPFNLKGQSRVNLTFDYQRGGRASYPLLWDNTVMHGSEQSVYTPQGSILRIGDSLIIEFKDTTSSKCNPEKWNRIVGIGGGQDFEFKNFWLAIPQKTKYFDSTFRFRIILKASDNAESVKPRDDADPWYLDNITLQVPRRPELEVMWVRVVTPDTKLPYSATQAIPLFMRVKNYTASVGISLPLRISILNSRGDTVYTHTAILSSLNEGRDTLFRFPDWDARNAIGTSNEFFVYGKIAQNGYDSYTDDNSTHSIFCLNVEQDTNAVQEFALDDGSNDIPKLTGIGDGGIGFDGTSGSYAIKFTLPQADTLFGTRIYFARHNSATDYIRVSVLRGDSVSCVPGDTITSFVDMRRPPMNEFYPYHFPTPVALQAGTYWLSVSQLSMDNYMIGGDISRGGAVITVADSIAPKISPIYSSPYGTQYSLMQNNGDIRCMYAVEVPAGSGNWSPWMSASGFWPAHSGSTIPQAIKLDPQLTSPFIGAGTYLPMIRPMVGSFGKPQVHVAKNVESKFAFEAYPNPFTPGTGMANFNFTLTESSVVSAIMYDDLGRALRTLADRRFEKGEHALFWDGKDTNGSFVLNGVYTCQLSTGARTIALRLLVIR